MRYNRIAKDLNLTEEHVAKNLMFAEKIRADKPTINFNFILIFYPVTLSGTSLVFPRVLNQGIKIKNEKYKVVKIRASKTYKGVTG